MQKEHNTKNSAETTLYKRIFSYGLSFRPAGTDLHRHFLRTAGFRGFFQSAFGGLCGLGAVSLTSMFGAVLLTPNLFTVCVSVLLGLPGVIGMLFLRLILVAA